MEVEILELDIQLLVGVPFGFRVHESFARFGWLVEDGFGVVRGGEEDKLFD